MPAWLGLVLAAVLLSPTAGATLLLPVSLRQMAAESEVIVRAMVRDRAVTWDERHERILTRSRLEVLDPIKGAEPGEVLTLYQVGGELDGVIMPISGGLAFEPGEHVLLFAMRFGREVVTYGVGLGKYRVTSLGREPAVVAAYGEVVFVDPVTLRPGAAPPDGPAQPLDRFLARVRAAIAEKKR